MYFYYNSNYSKNRLLTKCKVTHWHGRTAKIHFSKYIIEKKSNFFFFVMHKYIDVFILGMKNERISCI